MNRTWAEIARQAVAEIVKLFRDGLNFLAGYLAGKGKAESDAAKEERDAREKQAENRDHVADPDNADGVLDHFRRTEGQ